MNKITIKKALTGIGLLALLVGCSSAPNTAGIYNDSTLDSSSLGDADNSSGSESTESGNDSSSLDWTNYVTAELVEFSVSNAECSYSDGSLELLVTFTNVSDKKVIAVEALALVNDVFGEEINRYTISGDKSFGPGKEFKAGSWGNSCYEMNEYSSEDNRLLDMEDLDSTTDVVIKVSKIAFEGGEILEF